MNCDCLRILQLAAKGNLPEKIDKASTLSTDAVKQLVELEFLKALSVSSLEGITYKRPRITLLGLDYLHEIKTQKNVEGEL